MDGMDREYYLQRVIMGLEQSIRDMKMKLEYLDEDNLDRKYTVKFLASMEENLVEHRKELDALQAESAKD